MAHKKPTVPLRQGDDYIYPITLAEQVLLKEDGAVERLDERLDRTVTIDLSGEVTPGAASAVNASSLGGYPADIFPHIEYREPREIVAPLPINADLFGGFDTNHYLNTEYSTEEKQVGIWLDGRPIYRKTFSKNITFTAATTAISLLLDLPPIDFAAIDPMSFVRIDDANHMWIQFPNVTNYNGGATIIGGYIGTESDGTTRLTIHKGTHWGYTNIIVSVLYVKRI